MNYQNLLIKSVVVVKVTQYLLTFLNMAAQILTILIKFNKDIKGIMIGNTECKLVQFADDTTLILNGTVESLQAALNILEIFGSFSGLKVNIDKTQLVWIGKKKHSIDKVNIQNISWNTINKF